MSIVPPYPVTLLNGTTADANQVMADFNAVRNGVNANAANAPINTNITQLTALTTPISPAQGGTSLFVGNTSTGSANAQVLAATTPNNFALSQGNLVSWVAGFDNSGGGFTLQVGATLATTVLKMSGGALVALVDGDVIAGTQYYATFDGAVFELLNPSNTPMGTVTSVADATNGGIAVTNPTTTPTLAIDPSDLLVKASPTTSDSVLIEDAAAANAPKTATIASLLALTGAGTLTAGTPNTLNPYAINTTQSHAHGLSAAPSLILAVLKCLTAEHGYAIGEQMHVEAIMIGENATTMGFIVSADATNTYIVTGANPPLIVDKTTHNTIGLTPADWELIVTPYKIN